MYYDAQCDQKGSFKPKEVNNGKKTPDEPVNASTGDAEVPAGEQGVHSAEQTGSVAEVQEETSEATGDTAETVPETDVIAKATVTVDPVPDTPLKNHGVDPLVEAFNAANDRIEEEVRLNNEREEPLKKPKRKRSNKSSKAKRKEKK